MKTVPIDFEYRKPKDRMMDVVSVAYQVDGVKYNRWLYHDPIECKKFQDHIQSLKDYVFIAHNVVAEARSFISLGLEPLEYKWICTFAEYRCLTNHNDRLMFGDQLIKGKEVTTPRKKYGEASSVSTSKPEHSLASATYKMLGVKIDTMEKNDARDIIIYGTDEELLESKQRILDYGESDIHYLIEIFNAQVYEYKRLLRRDLDIKKLIKEMLWRGETMVRTAIMETEGYPIDYRKVRNFARSTGRILDEIAKDCNRQFPKIKPFTYDKKLNRYKQNTKAIKNWIFRSEYSLKWATTKTGFSLAREEWEKRFKNGHTFIEGNFGSQLYKYYYTKQHLNGFQSTKGKSRTFWDSVGSDKRVRPWLNPYRSQSARFQPTATDFIPLKASWMRSLIHPKEGSLIASIDYGSEEFLLSALLSNDVKMVEAYKSGDVYLAFAKEAEMVPQDATKHSHPKERQIAKGIVLGISYSMTKVGLAVQLGISEGEAQMYIDKFNRIYRRFYKWKMSMLNCLVKDEDTGIYKEFLGSYERDGHIKLPCGWYMWGDNDNDRSVTNVPIQGLGSSVLRKAIQLCQDSGLKVLYPLHDAIYIELKESELKDTVRVFKKCMVDAFVYYFIGTDMEQHAREIRTDIEVWGFNKECEFQVDGEKIVGESIHIDERSKDQYEAYKKYFEEDEALKWL